MAMYSTSFVGYFIWKGTIYNINISVAIQGIVPEIIKEHAREWFAEKQQQLWASWIWVYGKLNLNSYLSH